MEDAAAEDQPDLVGSADVEIVADDVFEEDPAGHGCVEHLGQGELRLQDRDLVAVARARSAAVNGSGNRVSDFSSRA